MLRCSRLCREPRSTYQAEAALRGSPPASFAANEKDRASAFERRFALNRWGDGWRDGIFTFAHFHSNAHEVLGIAEGTARVRFGGAVGGEFEISAGDAVLLPAGTGHQRLSSRGNLLVIGAYPPGPSYDLIRAGEGDAQLLRARIRAVPKPAADPIGGAGGVMTAAWAAEKTL